MYRGKLKNKVIQKEEFSMYVCMYVCIYLSIYLSIQAS